MGVASKNFDVRVARILWKLVIHFPRIAPGHMTVSLVYTLGFVVVCLMQEVGASYYTTENYTL